MPIHSFSPIVHHALLYPCCPPHRRGPKWNVTWLIYGSACHMGVMMSCFSSSQSNFKLTAKQQCIVTNTLIRQIWWSLSQWKWMCIKWSLELSKLQSSSCENLIRFTNNHYLKPPFGLAGKGIVTKMTIWEFFSELMKSRIFRDSQLIESDVLLYNYAAAYKVGQSNPVINFRIHVNATVILMNEHIYYKNTYRDHLPFINVSWVLILLSTFWWQY